MSGVQQDINFGRHSAPKRLLCLATYHKGGTIWMKHVITALSKALDIPWVGIWGADPMARVPKTGRAILVNWHGTFPKQLWDDTDAGFVNVIRDPRDILLSGCQYHHYAGPAGEGFLHVPRADLGGLTYQQTLQNMQSLSAKLLFEMNEKHAQTLREMLAWPSDHPRPVLNGSGKVAPAKSAAAPATAPAKIENTTETQSGYTSPQTAPVSTGVNPECPAGASLFTGGAGLCPQ